MSRPSNERALILGSLFLAALAACGDSTPAPRYDGNAPDRASTSDGGTKDVGPDSGKEVGQADTSANACGERHYGPGLSLSTIGPSGGPPYEGPAIVERSASDGFSTELILAFTPAAPDASSPDGGTDGGADGGTAPSPLHARITGLPAMTAFPVGAKVWLTKSTTGDPPFAFFGPPPPWWFAVRDKKDGRLLLAAGKDAPAAAFAPFTFDNKKTTCIGAFDDGCASGTATYSSVDVHGDATVAIEDGQTGTVRAGGADYDVEIMSRSITTVPATRCADYSGPYQGFAVGVKAKDLAALVATLAIGPQVACALGNADLKGVSFSFFDVDLSTPYDGKVVYTKRRTESFHDCFSFTTTLKALGGDPAVMEFCVPPGLFPEPAAGQELWATTTSWRLAALKGPNRGPLLLANVYADVPFNATTTTELESVLGIRVDSQARCLYADGYTPPYRLWDATFGATTPVVLGPDGHATVTIGSKSYDAWMWQSGQALGISIAAH